MGPLRLYCSSKRGEIEGFEYFKICAQQPSNSYNYGYSDKNFLILKWQHPLLFIPKINSQRKNLNGVEMLPVALKSTILKQTERKAAGITNKPTKQNTIGQYFQASSSHTMTLRIREIVGNN